MSDGSPAPVTADGAPAATPSTSGWHVDVPLVGPVGWPPTGSLAFLGTVVVLAAFEVVPWAVAGAIAVGHVLARDHDHRVLHEIGEGLESSI
jgi:hypothetical protein